MSAAMSSENQKIARRLIAADGYLDLMMPGNALRELDRIEDPGSFEASVYFLRGVSLQAIGDVDHAIPWLEEAARLIPAPLSRFAWKSLGECYTARGEDDLAEMARLMADSAEVLGDAAEVQLGFDLIVEPPNTRPTRKAEKKSPNDE